MKSDYKPTLISTVCFHVLPIFIYTQFLRIKLEIRNKQTNKKKSKIQIDCSILPIITWKLYLLPFSVYYHITIYYIIQYQKGNSTNVAH